MGCHHSSGDIRDEIHPYGHIYKAVKAWKLTAVFARSPEEIVQEVSRVARIVREMNNHDESLVQVAAVVLSYAMTFQGLSMTDSRIHLRKRFRFSTQSVGDILFSLEVFTQMTGEQYDSWLFKRSSRYRL